MLINDIIPMFDQKVKYFFTHRETKSPPESQGKGVSKRSNLRLTLDLIISEANKK